MPALRIVFFGTADLARTSLAALAGQPKIEVAAVVTQPDRPKGRDLKRQPSPVKQEAIARKLPVMQPDRARNPEFVQALAALNPDLIVVAAYGQILPPTILSLPHYGCLNVHASLLPKYRGAAPIQWAIIEGETGTGVTIMKMDAGLDTGDILTQQSTPIRPSDNAESLHDRLAKMGAELLLQTIPQYVAGTITPRPQPIQGATYARKITKEDGHLKWTDPARSLLNRVRAFTPWPGAFSFLPGEPKQPLLKIWEADVAGECSGRPGEILRADKTGIIVACGEGALRLTQVQREGGRRLPAHDFLAGYHLEPGQTFGSRAEQELRKAHT